MIWVAAWPKPWPAPARNPCCAASVGVAALQGESGQDADSSRCGEHLDVMAVHLVLERCRSHLVQAFKLQGHPAAIGKDEAVKPDSQAALIAVGDALGRTDGAGSPGDQNALSVAGVERHGYLGQGGAREVSRELGDQRGFQE